MARTLHLPANVVKRIASWVGRTRLLGAEHWGVPKAAPRSESRRSLPGTAVQITGGAAARPTPYSPSWVTWPRGPVLWEEGDLFFPSTDTFGLHLFLIHQPAEGAFS